LSAESFDAGVVDALRTAARMAGNRRLSREALEPDPPEISAIRRLVAASALRYVQMSRLRAAVRSGR
jgi:hypothetical protein